MKLTKLSALLMLLFSSFFITACEDDVDENNDLGNKQTLSASKEAPANSSGATGTIDYSYRRDTRILTYTVTWSGLTGAVSAMHIHGTADPGFNAGVLQNIITSSNGIATPGSRYGASGSFSASLFMDNVAIKEADLLAGKLYINIHTATYPNGEIRAQIVF